MAVIMMNTLKDITLTVTEKPSTFRFCHRFFLFFFLMLLLLKLTVVALAASLHMHIYMGT